MSRTIFLLHNKDGFLPLNQSQYESEDAIQELLAQYPELLLPEDEQTPYTSLLLIRREIEVRCGMNTYYLDHLFVDQEGIPILVEVKQRKDTRSRREVVAQMLDYAANGIKTWTAEELERAFHETCRKDESDTYSKITEFLGESGTPECFWQQVEENLQNDRIKMVFFADEISAELKSIIEYLNREMKTSQMLAIELKHFTGGEVQVFVPRVYGLQDGIQKSRSAAWTEARFIEKFRKNNAREELEVIHEVMEWAVKHSIELVYSTTQENGNFAPQFQYGKARYSPFFFWTTGKCEVMFHFLQSQPPFDQETVRRELLDRLNDIPGIAIPEEKLVKKPKFPLKLLVPQDSRKKFLQVMEWIDSMIHNLS